MGSCAALLSSRMASLVDCAPTTLQLVSSSFKIKGLGSPCLLSSKLEREDLLIWVRKGDEARS